MFSKIFILFDKIRIYRLVYSCTPWISYLKLVRSLSLLIRDSFFRISLIPSLRLVRSRIWCSNLSSFFLNYEFAISSFISFASSYMSTFPWSDFSGFSCVGMFQNCILPLKAYTKTPNDSILWSVVILLSSKILTTEEMRQSSCGSIFYSNLANSSVLVNFSIFVLIFLIWSLMLLIDWLWVELY